MASTRDAETTTGGGHAGTLVLLGDSIIDNRAYIRPDEPDVAEQVAARLPGWRVATVARDGAVIRDVVARQLPRVAGRTAWSGAVAVVSMGGNDLLGVQGVLAERADTLGRGLVRLAGLVADYGRAYEDALEALVEGRDALTLSLLPYPPAYPGAAGPAAATALRLFNDEARSVVARVNARNRHRARVAWVDLGRAMTAPACYANPIEPSAIGGARIAGSVATAVGRMAGRA